MISRSLQVLPLAGQPWINKGKIFVTAGRRQFFVAGGCDPTSRQTKQAPKAHIPRVVQGHAPPGKLGCLKALLECEMFRATCLGMSWRRCGGTSYTKNFTV